jgi:hypothetical protein
MNRRFPIRIIILAAGLLVAWFAFVSLTGWSAGLAESNLQANLIRITRYLNGPTPDAVLVGSSIAGRLLPECFREAGVNVANLGLDGSRPLFAFEVLERRSELPRRIVVDTSTLFQPLTANDDTLRKAMNSPTVGMGAVVPILRPEMRPSSVVYEKFKSLRESAGGGVAREPQAHREPASPAPLPDTYEEVRTRLRKYQQAGVEIAFLELPSGEGWAEVADGPARQLAAELNAPFWQPGPEIFQNSGNVLRFSDGLHLNGPSARTVSEWIAEKIQRRESPSPDEQR